MTKKELHTATKGIFIIFGLVLLIFLIYIWRNIFLFMFGDKINNFRVSSSFKSLPGVKVQSINTDDEGFSGVTVDVKDKGNIHITAFLPEYFNNPEHLFIRSIGSCTFKIYKFGYHGYGNTYATSGAMVKKDNPPYFSYDESIDIGYKGAFAQLTGKTIHSVAEAIDNYDVILNTVKKWPYSQKDIYKGFTNETHTLDVAKDSPFITHKEKYDLDFKYFYTSDCTSKK